MANSVVMNVLAVVSVDDVLEKHGANNAVDAPVMLDIDCAGVFTGNVSGYLDPLPPESVSSATAAKWVLWRMTSLTFNAKYHCLITDVSVDDTSGCLVDEPNALWIEPSVPMLTLAGATVQPGKIEPRTEVVWASEVKKPGSVKYNINVKVVDYHGELQGYYRVQSAVAVS